jgi:protocatechuate 3,4-dioxygenase beta subunit
MNAPADLSYKTQIAQEEEPGERIFLYGKIYEEDGKTPASGILVYAYHTNIEGIYEKKGNETGNGRRHGHLRGWMLTNDQGSYAMSTTKPAPYPNLNEPAHVHITLSGTHLEEYWIPSTFFEGDSLINQQHIEENRKLGFFSAIVRLEQDEKGLWKGRRDIMIKRK